MALAFAEPAVTAIDVFVFGVLHGISDGAGMVLLVVKDWRT